MATIVRKPKILSVMKTFGSLSHNETDSEVSNFVLRIDANDRQRRFYDDTGRDHLRKCWNLGQIFFLHLSNY
jgi:hypothetical protein